MGMRSSNEIQINWKKINPKSMLSEWIICEIFSQTVCLLMFVFACWKNSVNNRGYVPNLNGSEIFVQLRGIWWEMGVLKIIGVLAKPPSTSLNFPKPPHIRGQIWINTVYVVWFCVGGFSCDILIRPRVNQQSNTIRFDNTRKHCSVYTRCTQFYTQHHPFLSYE